MYRAIGAITGANGLRGDVNVKPFDEEVAWLETLEHVYAILPKDIMPLTITTARMQGARVVLGFKEITTRDAAERLKGIVLKAAESDLPELEADSFYVEQLVGLEAVSTSGSPFGHVADVLSSDAGEFLEVTPLHGSETVLVPFRQEFVGTVDIVRKTVTITGLDSLFEAVHTEDTPHEAGF